MRQKLLSTTADQRRGGGGKSEKREKLVLLPKGLRPTVIFIGYFLAYELLNSSVTLDFLFS